MVGVRWERRTVFRVVPRLLASPGGAVVKIGVVPLGNGSLNENGPVKLGAGLPGAAPEQSEEPLKVVLPFPVGFDVTQVPCHVVWEEKPSLFCPALATL